MKINDRGEVTEYPAESVLADPAMPEEIAGLMKESRETADRHAEKSKARQAREGEIMRASSRVGHGDKRKEAIAGTEAERDTERVAMQEAKRAKRTLDAALIEHGPAVRAIEARLTLAAHGRMVDALIDAEEAEAEKVGPIVPWSDLVPTWDRSQNFGDAEPTALENADRVNTAALVEVAGDDCGLVRVEATGEGPPLPFFTTKRRAAMLTNGRQHHSARYWKRTDDDETDEEA